ncbi:MAG: DUF1559 domain-containing protein [Pirellulales bacterium]|nr:DUF1559 domain-containing protein [Pirellulales bacterium]
MSCLARTFTGCRRRGFTLIELLVVIAIIGILVGMMVPALGVVREYARRTECANRLKSIGTAIALHVNTEDHYPEGRNSRDQIGVSWAFRLLPHLDAGTFHETYDETKPAFAPENAASMRTPVQVYFCPSRRSPSADRNFDNNNDLPTVEGAAAGGDYAANAGTYYMNSQGVKPDSAGPIYTYSKVRPIDVVDGLVQTIAVGDRHIPPPMDDVVDAMVHHFQGDNSFYAADSPWTLFADTRRGLASSSNDQSRTKFGSEHPGVTQFLFLDGHAKRLNNNTQLDVLRALSTIAAGVDADTIPTADEGGGDT